MTGRRESISTVWEWAASTPERHEQPGSWALRDLARRKNLPETRDLTGILMGDPPNGRSALEKKRAAEQRAAKARAEAAAKAQALLAGFGCPVPQFVTIAFGVPEGASGSDTQKDEIPSTAKENTQ
jgi:hypothetical protein